MNNRREFFTRALAEMMPEVAPTPIAKSTGPANRALPPKSQGRGGDQFPNVELITHQGKQLRFYDDMINNKVVVINFMSIRAHREFPVTDHVKKIAELLSDKLGRETYIWSITTDPLHDTPERLAIFAEQHGVKPGWQFVTGSGHRIGRASKRVLKHLSHHGHGYGFPTRIIHYGNGGVGLWGAFPAEARPEMALMRLSWVQPGKPVSGPQRKAGPRKLAGDYKSPVRIAT